jgi:hypothetical protein
MRRGVLAMLAHTKEYNEVLALAAATLWPRRAKGKLAPTGNTRTDAIQALSILSRILVVGARERPELQAVRDATVQLVIALVELDRGLVAPILQPQKLSNRPPMFWWVRDLQRRCASACHSLINLKVPRETAAEEVRKAIDTVCLIEGLIGSPVTAKTILNWRRKYKKDVGRNGFDLRKDDLLGYHQELCLTTKWMPPAPVGMSILEDTKRRMMGSFTSEARSFLERNLLLPKTRAKF